MKNKKGFTLAEIIISMTIVGVIAAITIPALLVATNDKALEAQKKALYARVSQAMSQIEDLRVYAKTNGNADKSSALNFITKGLSKVYRITASCPKDRIFNDCGFPEEITTQNGETFKLSEKNNLVGYIDNSTSADSAVFGNLDTEVAGFKTANGESIALFYNPKCHGSKNEGFYQGNAASAMCLNMIYDLNGKEEAPNEVGKDIGFITVFFPKDPDIVSPNTYVADSNTTSFSDYADVAEACRIQNKSLVIPTWGEGMSIALNKQLTNVDTSKTYVVSGAGKTSGAYNINVGNLISGVTNTWSGSMSLRCIYNK